MPDLSSLPPRVREIVLQEVAASEHWVGAVSVDDVLSHDLRAQIARVRDAIWWRLRREIKIGDKPASYPQIGRWFGRDHSSIMLGVKRFPKQLEAWAAGKNKFYAQTRQDHAQWAATVCPNITAPGA